MDIEEVVGIGKYSERRAKIALEGLGINIKSCWHLPLLLLHLPIKIKELIGEKILFPFCHLQSNLIIKCN